MSIEKIESYKTLVKQRNDVLILALDSINKTLRDLENRIQALEEVEN